MNSYIEDEYFYGINNQDSHLFDNFDKEIEGNEEKATDLQENQNDIDCISHPVKKNNKDIKEEDNCCQKTRFETKNKEEQINLEKKESIIPKEEILKVENTEEDINKLKNDLTQPLNKKRGRTKTGNNESTHTRFSDDNLRRKVKHIILKNLMDFINDKIYYFYQGNIGKGILIKRFLTINQKQKADATVTFNKIFLNKTLGDIYSEDISSRFTIYPPNHNKILVNQLINDKDENIKQYFINLFNLTFTDCLEHFRRTKYFKELEGLLDIGYINHKYEDDKDYIESLSYYFNNFEKITNNKRRRNRRKKKHIEESQ